MHLPHETLALRIRVILSSGDEWPVAKIMFASAQISITFTTSGNTLPLSSNTGMPHSLRPSYLYWYEASNVGSHIQRQRPPLVSTALRAAKGLTLSP